MEVCAMKKKILATLLVGSLMGGLNTADAGKEGELLIWINGDKGYRGLAELGKKFEEEMGIKVKVEAPEGLTDKFQQAAKSGKGPDILFWAHDRLGEWAGSGLLSPIEVDASLKNAHFEFGWDAFMHDGKLWGYPIAGEAVSLIYNKKLISNPPSQIADMTKVSEAVKKKNPKAMAIMWDYNNTYFTWGVLASGGAYVFGGDEGDYDVADVGVAVPGSVKALEEIVGLIDSGVMARGATYSVMESKMNSGELAMMISGPWAWSNLRKSGIDFDLAPVPGSGGNPGKPFVGVQGAMLNRSSPNHDLAIEFLEKFLMKPEGLKLVNDDVPIGVPANKEFYKQIVKENPLVAKTKENLDNGVLMPNVPEMGRFWSAMAASLENPTTGQATPEKTLNNAKKNIIAE
jgi:maltose/maltodextrin transport system substrate-binding protein